MISNVVCPIVLVVAVTMTGCSRNATTIPSPPVSASCSSNKDMGGVRFSFHKWKEGLAIMFVDQMNGGVTENGSLDGTTYTDRVSVRREDGIGYEWQLTTKDGRSADLRINDVSYDLTRGALFAIQLDGKNVIVHQVDRDLSKLNIDLAQCTAFVHANPDLIQLVTDDANRLRVTTIATGIAADVTDGSIRQCPDQPGRGLAGLFRGRGGSHTHD